MNRHILLFFGTLMLLMSCSVQRRFNSMVKNHPELILKTDTVYRTDSIIVPSIAYDSTVIMVHDTVSVSDTVIVAGAKVSIRYSGTIPIASGGTVYYKVNGDRLAIRVEIPKRVIPTKMAYIRTTVKVTRNVWTSVPWYVTVFSIIIIIIVIILVLKKVLSKIGLTI